MIYAFVDDLVKYESGDFQIRSFMILKLFDLFLFYHLPISSPVCFENLKPSRDQLDSSIDGSSYLVNLFSVPLCTLVNEINQF